MSGSNLHVQGLDEDAAQEIVRIARRGLERFLREGALFQPQLDSLPRSLSQPGSSFVTLTNHGALRGCIGSTEARHPLALDVVRNAISASTRDYRFPPVTAAELPEIRLEVTVLTNPVPLEYNDYDDLVANLHPGVHGVILTSGDRKGLLLPQVWDRLPEPDRFLEMIARKAGFPARELRNSPPTIQVHVFEAHHYAEQGYRDPGS